MFNPLVPNAEFVELYNSSSTDAFDLSGWNINGLSYVFPPGSFIRPQGFIVLAKDRFACLYAYGGGMRIFDIFTGNLQSDGETLSLIKPGATLAEDLLVDKVRYEPVLPWPMGSGGLVTASSLQLLDPSQDNSRPCNWATLFNPAIPVDATNIVGSTNFTWRFVSVTATNNVDTNSVLLFLDVPGNLYIDDLSIVDGPNAAVGPNLISQGDFETAALDGNYWQ